MSFKNRNVRFWGLVALPAMLLSGYIVGCSTTQDVDVKVTPPGVVYGAVRDAGANGDYDKADDPLQDKTVKILPPGTGTMKTTDEGFYVIMAPPGRYTVEASGSGYGTATRDVDIEIDKVHKRNFGLIKSNPGGLSPTESVSNK